MGNLFLFFKTFYLAYTLIHLARHVISAPLIKTIPLIFATHMNNFTRLLFTLMLCYSTANAQVSIGIRGGYTIANLLFEQTGRPLTGSSTSHLNSAHADLLLNVPLRGGLYLQPVIRYVTKGANFQNNNSVKPVNVFLSATDRIKVHYLELPLNIVYKIPVGIGRITVGAGPYVAYGMTGKYNTAIEYNGRTIQKSYQNIEFSEGNNVAATNMRLRRWEGGANFMVGLEFNNMLTLGANYSYGMSDLDKTSYTTVKNRYLGISMGFLLNREDW